MQGLKTFEQSGYQARTLQLFKDMDGADLAVVNRLIAPCEVLQVGTGQPVIVAHTADNHLYIVLDGALDLLPQESARSTSVGNQQFSKGECVGELSVLDNENQPYTIRAACDSVLLAIDGDTLWRLIDESNGVARNLLRLLSFRIRASNALLRRRHRVGEFYRQMSMIDGLTGMHNRAWLQAQLSQLMEHAVATGSPLSIIMVDLDHFKKFNDTHGHIIGDDAIQTAAKILNSTLRPTDFSVRYGGEEMLVILPDTSRDASIIVAERLCAKLAQTRVLHDEAAALPHITASFGVATLNAGQDASNFIATADAALYRAKKAGRNRVSR